MRVLEINEMLFMQESAADNDSDDINDNDDGDDNGHPNRGTLLLDATCAPADITYPQDIKLLLINIDYMI